MTSGPTNRKGRLLIVILAATLLLLGYNIIKRMFTSEEDRIRGLLYEMAEAVEDRKALKAASYLTPDFVIDPDGWTKGEVQRILIGYFRRVQGRISVALKDIEIEITDDRSTASLLAGFAEGGELAAGLRPDRAFAFRVFLVKADGEWRIERAEKAPAEW